MKVSCFIESLLLFFLLSVAVVVDATNKDTSSSDDMMGFADVRDIKIVTVATGDQESPEAVDTDTKARLILSIDAGLTHVDYILGIKDGEDITQAHLHCGHAGDTGPPVAFVLGTETTTAGIDIDGVASQGTLTNDNIMEQACGIDGLPVNNIASLFAAIRLGIIYVNVHSEEYPAGVVRGQLFI